ncbi:ganglioside induced differentiation associated protein, partial [Danaus plexippus plexippus]
MLRPSMFLRWETNYKQGRSKPKSKCRTGEVVVTSGFALSCRHIIHTVSPKYVDKYHTAAESSLHNCY